MGVLDALTRMLGSPSAGKYRTVYNDAPVTVFAHQTGSDIEGFTVEELWRTQPHLRTVIDFVARNIAQLGLHVFISDGDEVKRQRDSPVASLLKRPNSYLTGYEMIAALVGDLMLYDEAYLAVDLDDEGRWQVHVLPASWVTPVTVAPFAPPVLEVIGVDSVATRFSADEVVMFKGWTPGDPTRGTSPVETLRMILEEQHSSRVHRKQVWANNGRVGSYVARPMDAPKWDNAARKRFYEMLQAFMGNGGARAGSMPMLEDGMELKRVGFSAKDEEWSEAEKLSLATVAQVYHVNPTMVGLLDNANYSNVREFRRSLYGDSLGPVIKQIEERINEFLLPLIDANPDEFVEFNVEAKLRGSFEEQANVLSASVGGPWMTRNEARRLRNLAPVEGGDELITPLNVTAGGQASPVDGGDGRPPQEDV